MTRPPRLTDSLNRSFYNDDSPTYDEQRWSRLGGAQTDRAQQRIVRSLCAGWNNQRVLEVGPGTGRFSIPLLRQGNFMTLADISPGMLATARSNIESAGLSGRVAAYAEQSIYNLDFPDSSFDHAMSLNVFNHLERPGEALRQLARVIRPGSTLLFNYANLRSYYWLAARRIARTKKAIGQNVYSTWERPSDVRRMIHDAGLELIAMQGHVHVPRSLENFRLAPAVYALDAISRHGPFRGLAPFHFCMCRKH